MGKGPDHDAGPADRSMIRRQASRRMCRRKDEASGGEGMNVILWITIGGLAGWIASLVMKSRSSLLMNIIVGVIGAFIGGWLFGVLGIQPAGGFAGSLVTAVVGAVILIFALQVVQGRR